MAIFMLLNGMGLAFLLYALVNFWNEGQRPVAAARVRRMAMQHGDKAKVTVVNCPISPEIHGDVVVMPVRFQQRKLTHKQSNGTTAAFSLQVFRKSK